MPICRRCRPNRPERLVTNGTPRLHPGSVTRAESMPGPWRSRHFGHHGKGSPHCRSRCAPRFKGLQTIRRPRVSHTLAPAFSIHSHFTGWRAGMSDWREVVAREWCKKVLERMYGPGTMDGGAVSPIGGTHSHTRDMEERGAGRCGSWPPPSGLAYGRCPQNIGRLDSAISPQVQAGRCPRQSRALTVHFRMPRRPPPPSPDAPAEGL